ncbi:MAG: amino acid ABC transporter ATP-binding protein [Firmicutes bacterium]|nr:amino acid ABC transporter ATP-binding protein [Bacillota bacterium]
MIELRHVRKEFEDVTPLVDVNVTINSGDVISVIGPSGTGKSTLLRCINMLEPPTSGEIIVDGQVINDGTCDLNEIRKKMGMVFQSFNLFGHLTIIENIMNPQITLLGRSRQEAFDNAMRLLNTVGLGSKAFNYPEDLSGGQQQRVAIARTLAMDPDIILFDEPTSALDPGMIGEVQAVIRMLAKSGITMMIVTHEMEFARKVANRVFFMDEGGIYEEGTPQEIFEHPKKPNTIKFIKRLTSLTYKIETDDYDFTEAYDELQQYAEKLLIENERISDVQIAIEEIVVNNIMEQTDSPDVLIKIEYSEKLDTLTLSIRYKGEYHDPKESDNELFLELLEESTTELLDRVVETDSDIYNNLIQLTFKWEA